MGPTKTINFRDLPTVFDEAPDEAHRRAACLGRTIQAATAWRDPGKLRQTALPCRRHVGKRPCTGRLRVCVSEVPSEIHWECPTCDDRGAVSNWSGTDADLSDGAPAGSATGLRETTLSAEGYELLLDFDYPGCSRLVHGAAEDDGAIVLRGSAREFDDLAGWLAGDANHAKPGRRRRMLDELYEAVEAAL